MPGVTPNPTTPQEAAHRFLIPKARKAVRSFGVTYRSPPVRRVRVEPVWRVPRKGKRSRQTVGKLAAQATRQVTQETKRGVGPSGLTPLRAWCVRRPTGFAENGLLFVGAEGVVPRGAEIKSSSR